MKGFTIISDATLLLWEGFAFNLHQISRCNISENSTYYSSKMRYVTSGVNLCAFCRALGFNLRRTVGLIFVLTLQLKRVLFCFPFFALTSGVGHAVAEAVSRGLLTASARGRAQGKSCGICGGQSDDGSGFLRVLRFTLPPIPPTAPHLSSLTWGWYNSPNGGWRTKRSHSHPPLQ
jgi:hypothetical protein